MAGRMLYFMSRSRSWGPKELKGFRNSERQLRSSGNICQANITHLTRHAARGAMWSSWQPQPGRRRCPSAAASLHPSKVPQGIPSPHARARLSYSRAKYSNHPGHHPSCLFLGLPIMRMSRVMRMSKFDLIARQNIRARPRFGSLLTLCSNKDDGPGQSGRRLDGLSISPSLSRK